VCKLFLGGWGLLRVHVYYKSPSLPLNRRHQSANGQVPPCLFPRIVGPALLALSQSHEAVVVAVWLHRPMGTNIQAATVYERDSKNNEALNFFLYFIYSFCFSFS